MAPLENDQLIDLEDAILDNFYEMLQRKNADGTLEKLLREMGMQGLLYEVLGVPEPLATMSDGKILVVGARPNNVKDLQGIAKDLGVNIKRFEFLEYERATNYGFDKLEYATTWAAIIFGPNPHSTEGRGDSNSIIDRINANPEMYPPMCEMREKAGALKITNTGFRETLEELIARGIVAPG